ncbi:MAG: hypothetical protein IKO42_04980, partial [Opitutales bacterium]|nr:hypothetical protein [Opitutales bacterium]
DTNARLETLRASAAELRSAKEQSEHSAEFSALRKKDLLERIAQISNELNALEEQSQALEGRARGDSEVRQMQLNLVSGSDENFAQQTSELNQTESELKQAELELERIKQDVLVAEGGITRLRSNCTTLEVDLKSYQVRHAGASDAIFQMREEMQVLSRQLEEINFAGEQAKERLASAESDILLANQKVDATRASYRDCQVEIQNKDRQLAGKAARLSLLNDFQNRMEGFSDGVKAIMQGKISDILPPSQTTVISQNVEVEEGWTSAFETMMGSSIDAISLKDASKLAPIIAAIREKGLGKACVKIATPQKFESPAALPQNIFKASDFVRSEGGNEELKGLVENLVAGCYFCEDICDFEKFASQNQDFKFSMAVSRAGDIMDSRGIVYISNNSKKDTESSFILRNREIKRLNEEIASDNAALTALHEKAMKIQADLDAAEAQVEQAKASSAEVRREIASIEAQGKAMEANISNRTAEIEKQQALLSEMENSKFEAQDKLDAAMREMKAAEESIASGRQKIAEAEQKISELRALKEQKFSALSGARLDLAEKKSRLENLERGLSAIREQQRETAEQIERRKAEKSSIETQIASLETDAESEKQKAQKIAEELEVALKTIEENRAALNESETQVAQFEESMNAERTRQNELGRAKNEIEVRLATLKSRLSFIVERILSDYETNIAFVDWKKELWLADEEFEIKVKLDDLEDGELEAKPKRKRGEPTQEDFDAMESLDFAEFESEVKDLRDKISAMGSVNLVAIEEYAELKERYDFLTAQSDDLWKSKNELVAAIDEINATSQQLFAETFEQIRKNFEFTFKKIFGGGAADDAIRDAVRQKCQERNALWGGVRFTAPEKGDYTLVTGTAGWEIPKSD